MEDFVTFDIAKKLKEKGFKEKCIAYYWISINEHTPLFVVEDNMPNEGICIIDLLSEHNKAEWSPFVDTPTISQVLKWLREVKGIDILPQRGHINLDNNGKATRYYNVNIYFERRFACTLDNDEQDYSTYEQAAIAGIGYVVDNLI